MKILVVSYLFPNSKMPDHGIFVFNRLKALSKYTDIRVINPIPWSPVHRLSRRYRKYPEVPLQEEIGGLKVYHPRFLSIPGVLKALEARTYTSVVAQTTEKIAHEFSFDLVDMHWTYPDLPAGLDLATRYRKPSIVTLRGKEAFYREGSSKRAALINSGLRRVDRVISLSQEMADMSNKLVGPNDKTTVILNGVDVGNFYYLPIEKARLQLGLPLDTQIILTVGSLIRRKGFDLIIEALHRLQARENRKSPTKLYIVGAPGPEGDFMQALQRQVREFQLTDSVVFVGPVPNAQLPIWYNAANVFCLASRGEGSPNVLTEALACGCPSVASAVGAVPDIIDRELEQGICFEPENIDELTGALQTALANPYNRKLLAERSAKYDWDLCAKQVMEVYRDVLFRKVN